MSVVLMLRKAKLPAKTIKALEKAGHVPVVVDSFNDVAILAPEAEGAVVEAALATVSLTGNCRNTRADFAELLANKLHPIS